MFLLICRSLAIVLPALLLTLQPQPAAAQTKLDPEVEALLQERLTALRDLVELQQEQFKIGIITLDVVLTAEIALGQAELELAKTAAERIKIRENLFKKAQEFEKVIVAYVDGGRGNRTHLLQAKAARLRAHADLLQEKKSATPK